MKNKSREATGFRAGREQLFVGDMVLVDSGSGTQAGI